MTIARLIQKTTLLRYCGPGNTAVNSIAAVLLCNIRERRALLILARNRNNTEHESRTDSPFRPATPGTLIRPDDADYDQVRAVWNRMINRRPALIARCADAQDVVNSVNFVRTYGLQIAVRGGRHNVAGHATNDSGLVIDLSPMNQVTVDPAARIAGRGDAMMRALFGPQYKRLVALKNKYDPLNVFQLNPNIKPNRTSCYRRARFVWRGSLSNHQSRLAEWH